MGFAAVTLPRLDQHGDVPARLTEAAGVARVQTLQTIRTSRSEAGVPI